MAKSIRNPHYPGKTRPLVQIKRDFVFRKRFQNGIGKESYNTGGIDSLQALSLAITKIKSRFKDLSKEYDFYWPESNEPMESIDYDFIVEKFSNLPKGNASTAPS